MIIDDLHQFHVKLAKSSLTQEEYQPLSAELIRIKDKLRSRKIPEVKKDKLQEL